MFPVLLYYYCFVLGAMGGASPSKPSGSPLSFTNYLLKQTTRITYQPNSEEEHQVHLFVGFVSLVGAWLAPNFAAFLLLHSQVELFVESTRNSTFFFVH
tara:strand:+ start:204 stop:500 length:297 start_codon:yes stop_codon:yes gene_type:complete